MSHTGHGVAENPSVQARRNAICGPSYLRNLLVVLSARTFPEVWQVGQ